MAIDSTSIVGAGRMGHGLALQFARHGRDVTLVDHRESNLERAETLIREAATFLRERGSLEATPDDLVDAIVFTTDGTTGVADADLVLETVSEDVGVKREVFRDVVAAAPPEAILASNTSGIRIGEIAEGIPDHADRLVGCHWWNPPYLMPTVEVVRGPDTADDVFERTASFVRSVGRDPIRVERDVPGFVWNRIQNAVLREAIHVVEEGIASLDDVNRAVRDGYALRTAAIGPFETVDLSGLDLFRTVAAELYPHLATDDEPQRLFDERLDAGRSGVEAGAGFFEYDASPESVVRRRDELVTSIIAAREAADDR